jgi:nickel-dependent lactate racemase
MGLLYLFTKNNTRTVSAFISKANCNDSFWRSPCASQQGVTETNGGFKAITALYQAHEALSAAIITFKNGMLHIVAAPTGDNQFVNQVAVCDKQDTILTAYCTISFTGVFECGTGTVYHNW